jgi:hypothetical protein
MKRHVVLLKEFLNNQITWKVLLIKPGSFKYLRAGCAHLYRINSSAVNWEGLSLPNMARSIFVYISNNCIHLLIL